MGERKNYFGERLMRVTGRGGDHWVTDYKKLDFVFGLDQSVGPNL